MLAAPAPDVTLAMPCYNERDNITDVLTTSVRALNALGRTWEILVVDNHSSDGTPDVVREFAAAESRVRLIVHDTNRFYSGSCRTILTHSRGQFVAIMDSDGQFSAEDMPKFLAALEGGANLVMGWRKKRHDPLSRRLMSLVFNLMAKYWIRYPLHDLNVGLRMFDRRFMTVARIRHSLNLANPELYVSARKAGMMVAEVAVAHAERTKGKACHDFHRLFRLFVSVVSYFRDLHRELNSPGVLPVAAATIDEARSRRVA